MSAGRIDDLAILLLGGAVALWAVFLVGRRPTLGIVGYAVVLGFVPVWFGVSLGLYLSPAFAASGVVVIALARRDKLRMAFGDLYLALVLGLIAVSTVLGYVTFARAWTAIAGWGLPYVAARVLHSRIPGRTIYTVLGVVMTAVAALALVEFVTQRNLFVELRVPNSLYAQWAGLRYRGGRLRVEGAFGNSIALGAALAMSIPLVWSSRLASWARFLSLILIAAASVVTFSRIGLATTAIALVLSVLFLSRDATPAFRRYVVIVGVLGALAAIPTVASVFSAAGDEATNSASYRGSLLSLVPSMAILGQSDVAFRTGSGSNGFGAFESIDSALILIGLTFGVIPLLLVLGGALAAAWAMLRRRPPSPALVALVATFPALTSVAFINQFTTVFWFLVGLAVAEWAASTTPSVAAVAEAARRPLPDLVAAPPGGGGRIAAQPWRSDVRP